MRDSLRLIHSQYKGSTRHNLDGFQNTTLSDPLPIKVTLPLQSPALLLSVTKVLEWWRPQGSNQEQRRHIDDMLFLIMKERAE
jgi:hypothetical protein